MGCRRIIFIFSFVAGALLFVSEVQLNLELFELLKADLGRMADDEVVGVDVVVQVTELVLENAEGGRSCALSCSQLGLFSITA